LTAEGLRDSVRTLIESRMYFRHKQSQGRFYLQIVESHRTGDQVRQRVIATLVRLDELESSGQLDRLLRSGARFVGGEWTASGINLKRLPLTVANASTRPTHCSNPENGAIR
jgi:hypothetical protein